MRKILKKITLAVLLPLNLLQTGFLRAETVFLSQDIKRAGYLSGLFRNIFWKRFKIWWRRIGRINPKGKRKGGLFSSAPYAMSISTEQYKVFSADLKAYIRGLEFAGLPTTEAKLLRYMLMERLSNLRMGPRSMFTRMMPSPNTIEKEKSLQRLEKNIDLLIRLRRQGKINSREFRKSLKRVKQDIILISVYRIVAETYGRFWFLSRKPAGRYKQKDLITRQLKLIEEHILRYRKRIHSNPRIYSKKTVRQLERKFKKTQLELNRIRMVIPNLLAMIDNLEK